MGGVAAIASVVISAYSAYSANENADNALDASRDAADRADPAARERSYYQDFLKKNFPQMAAVDPEQIKKDPNYIFQKEQGMAAINNDASAQGLTRSGTRLMDLEKFGSGLASSFVDKKFAQNMSLMTQLGSLGGFTTGSPAAAGQLLANGGQNAFANGNNVMSQVGGVAGLINRNWGGTSSSTGSGASSTVDDTTWGGA